MRTITKVVLTGASGFVGREVEGVLRDAWLPVVSVLRPTSNPQWSYRRGSRIHRGNVLNRESLRPAFKEPAVDALVHLVGIIEERDENRFHRTHVEGTHNVVELAREIAVKKLVHMSALGTRPGAVSSYHRTKWEAEELVRNSGLPFTILRPSIIFGDDCEFLLTLIALLKMPMIIPLIGGGHTRLQPVWVRDVARIVHTCLTDERTDGKTYEIGGPEVVTLRRMVEMLAHRLDRRKPIVSLPLALGHLLAMVDDIPTVAGVNRFVNEYILGMRPLNRDQLQMMQEHSVCDTAPLKECFDWQFESLTEWLPASPILKSEWRPWKGRWIIPPPDLA